MMLKVTGKAVRSNVSHLINIGIERAESSRLFRIIRPAYYTEGIYGKNMEIYPAFRYVAFVSGALPTYDYRLKELPNSFAELERIDALLNAIEDDKERTEKAYPLYFSFLNFCAKEVFMYEEGKNEKNK